MVLFLKLKIILNIWNMYKFKNKLIFDFIQISYSLIQNVYFYNFNDYSYQKVSDGNSNLLISSISSLRSTNSLDKKLDVLIQCKNFQTFVFRHDNINFAYEIQKRTQISIFILYFK